MTRLSWDSYFMQMAELVSTRSSCLRGKVGAVIVMENQVLSTGYNGPPRGIPHCIHKSDEVTEVCPMCDGSGESGYVEFKDDEMIPVPCIRCDGKGALTNRDQICIREANNIPSGQRHELCRGLHAEQNAIIQAARHGICVRGSKIYCNVKPCSICTKMIINAGIQEIVYKKEYTDPLAELLLEQSNLRMRKFE